MTDWTAFDRQLAPRRRAIVEGLVEFVRLNSVSQNPKGVRVTGKWLANAMQTRGLDGRVLETGGNPVVFGERRVPGATRTVLLYCHYDTKPIPPRGWLQPDPLEPVFRRGPAEQEAGRPLVDFSDGDLESLSLYARGSADDKGPLWCHLHALELMDALGLRPAGRGPRHHHGRPAARARAAHRQRRRARHVEGQARDRGGAPRRPLR